jgi:hemerythrin
LTEKKELPVPQVTRKSNICANHHDELIKKIDQLQQEIGDEWSASAVEHFTALLHDWLINHVIKKDMLMKPVLKKHSPKFDPR